MPRTGDYWGPARGVKHPRFEVLKVDEQSSDTQPVPGSRSEHHPEAAIEELPEAAIEELGVTTFDGAAPRLDEVTYAHLSRNALQRLLSGMNILRRQLAPTNDTLSVLDDMEAATILLSNLLSVPGAPDKGA